MNNTEANNTSETVDALIAAGTPREHIAAELVISALIIKLAADPELADMAKANDYEHFMEGCSSPAFIQKMGVALAELRELA